MAYARHSSNNRRPRTNNRGGNNNRNNNGGNNRRPQARLNHVYDSNGPEGRVRGTAAQIIEKYTSLANDANASGDKVLQQSFLQHAEHYQRILNEVQKEIDKQNERRAEQNTQNDDSNDTNNNQKKSRSESKKPTPQNKETETDDGKMTDVPGFLAGDAPAATKKEVKLRAPRKPKEPAKAKADVLETEPA